MSWLSGGRLPGPQRSPAVKRAPSKAQKAAGALFFPMSGTINPVVRSLRLQWPQAGRPGWQMELAPPLAGPFALRLTLHHHRRKPPGFALHTLGERTKAPIAGPLRPLSPRWAVARSPGGQPGLLLFVMQGAEQCVNEQPRCGGVVGAHCTAAIIFAGLCGTLRRVSSLTIRSD